MPLDFSAMFILKHYLFDTTYFKGEGVRGGQRDGKGKYWWINEKTFQVDWNWQRFKFCWTTKRSNRRKSQSLQVSTQSPIYTVCDFFISERGQIGSQEKVWEKSQSLQVSTQVPIYTVSGFLIIRTSSGLISIIIEINKLRSTWGGKLKDTRWLQLNKVITITVPHFRQFAPLFQMVTT